LHRIDSAGSPRVLDLDGDGLPDLTYLAFSQATGGREFRGFADLTGWFGPNSAKTTVRLRAIRGEPPTARRWMGQWERINALDGAGIPDFIRRERDGTLVAASGASGRPLWPGGSVGPRPGKDASGEVRAAAHDTVLSLPPGAGDLDGDGVPDLVVVDPRRKPVAAQMNRLLLPIRFVSGATGRTLWPAEAISLDSNVTLSDSGDPQVT